jgi:glycosyltransferase involved in cell wall biosynthesis
MENTENNAIHENQIISMLDDIPDLKCLFLTPLFILNKKGFRLSLNKRQGRKIKEVKLPLLSYNFYMNPFLIPFLVLFSIPYLFLYIKKNNIKVIHCRNYLSTLLGLICKRFFPELKIISDPRGIYPDEGAIIGRWKFKGVVHKTWKLIERWLFNNSDQVFALSKGMQLYIKELGINSIYIPAIVDENKFSFSSTDRDDIRSKLNFSSNETIYVYSGSIGLWHDAELLSQAIYGHQKTIKNKQYTILILGGRDNTKNYLYSCGHKKVLQLTLKPCDVAKYLAASDLAILPGQFGHEKYNDTLRTMISSKAEEYLVSGLPILCNYQIQEVINITKEKKLDVSFNKSCDVIDKGCSISLNDRRSIDRISDSNYFSTMFSKKNVIVNYCKVYKCLLR